MAFGQLLPGVVGKLDRYFLGALGVYLLAGILLIGQFRFQINPDALSYISIAQHYRDGLWRDAVNAYWSPLYSWLLVPLLNFKFDPLLAAKALNVAIGFGVLAGSWRLSAAVGLSTGFRRIFVFALVPIVLQWAFSVISPDLLTIALLLPFLTRVLEPGLADQPGRCAMAGLFAGLAYLAKTFALPFALAAFSLCLVWQTLAAYRRVRTAWPGAACFLGALATLTVPWVAVLSNVYQRVTLGTAGRFNFALIGPHSFWYPMLTLGLFPPPNEHALSSWEDPSFLPQRLWSPFSSSGNFAFWLEKIVSNCGDFCEMLNGFSILSLVVIGAALYLVVQRMRRNRQAFHPALGLLCLLFVFAGGYLLVFLEERYIWLCAIGVLLTGFLAIDLGCGPGSSGKRMGPVLALLLTLSFVFTPVRWMHDHREIDREYRDAAFALPGMRGSHFASNDMTALYYAYYKDAKFYGLPQGDPGRIAQQFGKYQIDRYLLIGPNENPPPFVDEGDRLDPGTIANLRVYRVRRNGIQN